MLIGQRSTNAVLEGVAMTLLLAVAAFPFLLMGGMMTLVGLLALGPRRRDIPELWICLPAGLALLGVFAGVGYWLIWGLPRRTITRFAFDGVEMVLVVPAHGCITRPIAALRSVTESHGRRRLLGWWLRFDGARAVFLCVATPNAPQLVDNLKSVLDRAVPAASLSAS